MKKIGIIGAGLSGLTAAYYLLKKGALVTIFEKSNYPGGMLNKVEVEGGTLDIQYHHIFKNHTHFIDFLKELGIEDKLKWHGVKMGVVVDSVIYPFNGASDLLTFKPLSFIGKLRFGLGALFLLVKKNDSRILDNEYAEKYLIRLFGKEVYNVIWAPLLRAKFGSLHKEVSAYWIHERMKSRASGKKGVIKGKEELGYMDGSFHAIVKEIERRIYDMGGEILLNERVNGIRRKEQGFSVTTSKSELDFDRVVSTVACPVFRELLDESDADLKNYRETLSKVRYLDADTTIVSCAHKVSEYYWSSIADVESPFVCMVEHTNMIDKEKFNGRNVFYLTKYYPSGEIKDAADNEKRKKTAADYMRRFNLDISDDDVKLASQTVQRFAQPVFDRGYLRIKPDFESPVKGFYVLNAAQVYPGGRTMDSSIKLAGELVKRMGIA